MATAQVYVKRFYTKVEIRRTNPFLVITTALYLACKMEETPQHIRLINQEARSLWTGIASLLPLLVLVTRANVSQTCRSSTSRPRLENVNFGLYLK